MNSDTLSIQLLGPPRIWLNLQPLHIPRRKSRALIYYLAAQRDRVTREQVLTLLWPDHQRPAARQILRTTLHGLRKALGPALSITDDALALAPDAEVDVRQFEARIETTSGVPELAATLNRYGGDFLAEFALPDAVDFEQWMLAERERYRRLAVCGLVTLAQQYEVQQDFAAALQALTRALTLSPLQEDLHQAVMRLRYLAGDRASAIRQYETLRKMLDEELGVPPLPETQALYNSIITDTLDRDQLARGRLEVQPQGWRSGKPAAIGSFSTAVRSAQRLPFIGRAAELQRLRELAAPGVLVLIEGEPGVGKTRLVEEFVRSSAALALVGTARELEQALPYQPMIEALRGLLGQPEWPALRAVLDLPAIWRRELIRLLPELSEGRDSAAHDTTPVDESRLWEGMRQFLLALGHHNPVGLFLDDLHWADTSTLALLAYLVRQTDTAPIFIIGAARPAGPRTALAALLHTLLREGRLARVNLSRLADAEVAALAHQLSPAHAAPLADWLICTSEGNPYILAELVRDARQRRVLLPDGRLDLKALAETRAVPQTVYSLAQSRLLQLSHAARRMLDVAVAAGRIFEFAVVARAAALPEAAALDALDELRTAGLVYPLDEARYAFDHSLTMEVAYHEVGELRHRVLHRQVAEAIEEVHAHDLDPVAGVLAMHFAEGNAPERAAPYAFRAGQRAAGLGAWAEAIGFYEQALEYTGPARRGAILMALGEAHLQAGESAQASEAFQAALALAQSDPGAGGVDVNDVRLALGQSFLLQGRYAEVITLVKRICGNSSPEIVARAEMVWGTALSLEGVDLAGAAEHLKRAEELVLQQGAQANAVSLAHSKFELGSLAAQQGDLEQAISLYRQALEIARRAATGEAIMWEILAYNNIAYHLHLLGDPAAREYADTGMQLAQQYGALGTQPYLYSTRGEIALAQGDITLAEQHFSTGLALAERLAMPERIAGLTANLGLVALRRDQLSLAVHRLSTAVARADALNARHLAAQIRLWLAPLLPPADARACLAEARAIAEHGGRRRLLAEIARLEATLFA